MRTRDISGLETWDDHSIFTERGKKLGISKIFITDRSIFLFSQGFTPLAGIRKRTHVILGYSPKNRTITFDFTNDSQHPGALKLTHRSGGSQVGSKAFFNYYLINVSDVGGHYNPKRIKLPKTGDVWSINLDSKLPEKNVEEEEGKENG